MKTNELKKRINDAKVISFDIFDTLISRKVCDAKDVFKLVEIRYNNGHEIKVKDFSDNRIRAEQICRAEKGKEICITEIYKKLSCIYGDGESKELEQLEIEVEKEITYRREDIYKIYRYVKNRKKKIILISDMYLGSDIMEQILDKNGINGYSKIYVSCDVGRTKSRGDLYKYIQEKEEMNGGGLLHIGDNYKSDILRGMQNGIRCCYIKRNQKFAGTKLFAVNNGNRIEEFGYNYLGPLMYGYVSWLHCEFQKIDAERIYFLSREGSFIKQCYERLYGKDKEKLRYIYVSRKSLVTPILGEKDMIDKIQFFRNIGVKNAGEYLQSLGLDELETDRFMNDNGIVPSDSAYKVLEKKECLSQLLKGNSNKSLDFVTQYLIQEGLKGTIAIVDVGWTGTMQIAIDKVLSIANIPHQIFGYFIGQRPEMAYFSDFKLQNKGWLCDSNDKTGIQDVLLSGNSLLEILLMAPHGTTERYIKVGEKVVPVVEKNEFESNIQTIIQIQNKALQFVEDMKHFYGVETKRPKMEYFGRFKSFLVNPDKEYVEMFGDIKFYDSGKEKIVVKYGGINPIKHIKLYGKSYWKIGYLRRNIPVKLPYLQVYSLTRTLGLRLRGLNR